MLALAKSCSGRELASSIIISAQERILTLRLVHGITVQGSSMSRLTSFGLGIVVGAAGLFVSENYYVVRSKETVNLIPKVAAKLEMPYYDIRAYNAADWNSHPSLALAIVKSKKEGLLVESGLSGMQSQFEGLLHSFSK